MFGQLALGVIRKKPKPHKRGGAAASAASGDAVTAPMQGTVVKVAVEEGQHVAVGELVVVLEQARNTSKLGSQVGAEPPPWVADVEPGGLLVARPCGHTGRLCSVEPAGDVDDALVFGGPVDLSGDLLEDVLVTVQDSVNDVESGERMALIAVAAVTGKHEVRQAIDPHQ